VGTALGGAMTLVGEPQNLLIGGVMGWNFQEFFRQMVHISAPVLMAGLATCALLEYFRAFGYGTRLSDKVRVVLEESDRQESLKRTRNERVTILMQGLVAVLLVLALGLHLAEPGIVGLMVIIL